MIASAPAARERALRESNRADLRFELKVKRALQAVNHPFAYAA
jgi:hypothetical protein